MWACSEPAGLKVIRYLRETIEMSLRLQAHDPRVIFLSSEDLGMLSIFVAEDPEALYRSRIILNRHIAAYGLDDWMTAGEHSLDDDHRLEWNPLLQLRDVLDASSSSREFVKKVVDSAPKAYLPICRQVLEAIVSVKCFDPRTEFLSSRERLDLAPFTSESANNLVSSLRACNEQISGLRLDARTDVTAVVNSLMDPPL